MKKIAIATLYNENFGCALQNYAVSKIFTDFGYKPETLVTRDGSIIGYWKRTAREIYGYCKAPHLVLFGYKILSFFIPKASRKYMFYKFKRIKPLNYRYVRKGKLPNAVKRYDYFVAGSDQVWNCTSF